MKIPGKKAELLWWFTVMIQVFLPDFNVNMGLANNQTHVFTYHIFLHIIDFIRWEAFCAKFPTKWIHIALNR